jgi:hypothetical protein
MEQKSEPRRRLTVFGREARTKRIFARMREGWAYDEIAREERLSPQRVRQIVSGVLDKRVIDRGQDHARLQLARLAPALRAAADALSTGDVKAIGPFIKVLDRLDKYQTTFDGKFFYGPEEREKLLKKINDIAARLHNPDPGKVAPADAAAGEVAFAEGEASVAAVDSPSQERPAGRPMDGGSRGPRPRPQNFDL